MSSISHYNMHKKLIKTVYLQHMAAFRLRVSLASYEIISTKSTIKQIGVQHLDILTDTAYGKVTSYSFIPHPVS